MNIYKESEEHPFDVFLRSVEMGDGCWQWLGYVNNNYGVFNYAGRKEKAHRFAYEMFVNQIPEGLHIDHLCRNKLCVRPQHLEAVTQAENNRRTKGYPKVHKLRLCTMAGCTRKHTAKGLCNMHYMAEYNNR